MDYGHGDHWECIFAMDEFNKDWIPKILAEGKVIDAIKLTRKWFDNDYESEEAVVIFSYPDGELSFNAICVSNSKEKTLSLFSMYPCINDGTVIELTVENIIDWGEGGDGIEGVIQAVDEKGSPFGFFDTKYYKNRNKYEIGKTYPFKVAAIVYMIEPLDSRTFEITEVDKIMDFYSKLGDKPKYDEDGKLKPLIFDLSQLVALLSKSEEYPDDFEFQFPINDITNFIIDDVNIYKIKAPFMRDPDIEGVLYVSDKILNHEISIGEPIRGVLWMQGFLDE
ncbi:MAG: hypothetical protein ABRQ24_03890 [Syntrophomonadaceae bacterium]